MDKDVGDQRVVMLPLRQVWNAKPIVVIELFVFFQRVALAVNTGVVHEAFVCVLPHCYHLVTLSLNGIDFQRVSLQENAAVDHDQHERDKGEAINFDVSVGDDHGIGPNSGEVSRKNVCSPTRNRVERFET